MSAVIHVGPAGWSYKDWEGTVYPEGRRVDGLTYLVNYFDMIEVNSTFYRPPAPSTTKRWATIGASRDGFRFTAKLYRGFTHEAPGRWSTREIQAFLDGMRPLAEAGLLGAVLVQFPWFFRAEKGSLIHLQRVGERFGSLPLVVEVRHRSWLEPQPWRVIEGLGMGFCNIDQPLARSSIRPASRATSPIGYFRMHGRNATAWFDRTSGRDSKYDYLYSPREIAEFVGLIDELREKTREIYVVSNNHFGGKAPANALEIAAAIHGAKVPVPPRLLQSFPRLEGIAGSNGDA